MDSNTSTGGSGTTSGGSRVVLRGRRVAMFCAWWDGHPAKKASSEAVSRVSGDFRRLELPRRWDECQKLTEAISRSEVVLIWNGLEPGCEWVASIAQECGVDYCYLEQGLVPCRGWWHSDRCGVAGMSRIGEGEIPTLDDPRIGKFLEHRKRWIEDLGLKPKPSGAREDSVLVALQHPPNPATLLCSNYKTTEEFLEDVRRDYKGFPIIATSHPSPTTVGLFPRAMDGITYCRGGWATHEMAMKFRITCAINSTALWEAAMLGSTPVAYGTHPIAAYSNSKDLLTWVMAVAFSRMVRFGETVEELVV